MAEQTTATQPDAAPETDYSGAVSFATSDEPEVTTATAETVDGVANDKPEGKAVDEPESPPPDTDVDAQIPTFSPSVLAEAAMSGIPENVVKMFKGEEEFKSWLASRASKPTTETTEADAKTPEKDATQTALYTPEPYQFTEEESATFDEDTKATLNRIVTHFQGELAKVAASVKGAIDPIGGVVGQIVQEREHSAVSRKIQEFDSALDANESLHPIVGNARPAKGSPQWEIRSAAFGEIDRINELTGGKLPMKELARRAVLVASAAMSGEIPSPATDTQKPKSAREQEAERRAALQDGQVLGKPSSATTKPPSIQHRDSFGLNPVEPLSGLM